MFALSAAVYSPIFMAKVHLLSRIITYLQNYFFFQNISLHFKLTITFIAI